MTIIDDIKVSLPHDEDCAIDWGADYPDHSQCNCPRREMVTFLERQAEVVEQGERICAALVDGYYEEACAAAARYCMLVDQLEETS